MRESLAVDRSEPSVVRPERLLFAPQSPRPLRPDAASDGVRYRRWAAAREEWRLTVEAPPLPGPEIAVLVVDDGATPGALRTTLDALARQTSDSWQLSITLIGSPALDVESAVADALGGARGRVRMHTEPEGTHRASACASALEESSAPAFAILAPGDRLAPDAVAQLSAALVDADVAYADEDRAHAHGLFDAPLLKPGWSPELLLGYRYTGHPVALRVAPVIAAGGIRPVEDGDWEHDLLLRVTERTARVAHVAAVLCHRDARMRYPDAAGPPGPGAVVAALERRQEAAEVTPGPLPATWRVRRHAGHPPSVSAIVPFKDSTRLLRACVDSLRETAAGVMLEVLLVDNGSTEPETATLVDLLSARDRVRVLRDDRPFNWAALNNAAAADARGEVLLFMNDDVRALRPGWLELLAAHALRPEIGAAGARLLYPDGRLQHGGIALGLAGATGHVLAGLEAGLPGYLGMAVLTRDVTAVTGACMATGREVFERLGGFDEGLGLDFNDVDYCLRARSRGLRVVYEPGAELVHHESPSRGTSGSEETAAAFLARWGETVAAGDHFWNPQLSHRDPSAALDDLGPVVGGIGARTCCDLAHAGCEAVGATAPAGGSDGA